jgi:aspartyl-tRNA(Asn)/glutamyl-tRNA(Gln) amidotransferase subunit B
VRTGIALNAEIHHWSRFDRKNYFYADLPQGYQISQLFHPIVGEGEIEVSLDEKDPEGTVKTIGIERIHVEQDAGKLMHDQHPTMSYVDLNRSGVALMEIVSRPDMRSPAEAGAYVRKLRSILRYVGSCDGNMEQGSMRADVNVSVRKPGDELGIRTETKNVNSIRFIQQVVETEARRQVDLLEDGGEVVQETRLFDPDKGETRSMRSKEDAHDYRYFPDPDLLPIELSEEFVEEARASLPELPDAKRHRYENELGLTAYNAAVLTADVDTYISFEELLASVAKASGKPDKDVAKRVANWLTSEQPGLLNANDIAADDPKNSVEANTAIVVATESGLISGSKGKEIFEQHLTSDIDINAEIDKNKQTSDTGEIEKVIAEILEANADKVEEYRGGKDKLFGFFVGQTMKAMAGKANPKVVNELLKKALG